ncbi:MAG: hypothetical protein KIG95_04665 [Comamonas sp.]|nr:hypothetical protein [Comamonas sp.]
MVLASLVVVGQNNNVAPLQECAVFWPPLTSATGVTGGHQPKLIEPVGILFAFHDEDGGAGLLQQVRQAVGHNAAALHAPVPAPACNIRAALAKTFGFQPHNLECQRPSFVAVVVGGHQARFCCCWGAGLQALLHQPVHGLRVVCVAQAAANQGKQATAFLPLMVVERGFGQVNG